MKGGQGYTNTPSHWSTKDKVIAPKSQTSNFPKYERPVKGECLAGSKTYFKYGKLGHHANDYRSGGAWLQGQGGNVQGVPSTNHLYALHGRQEVKEALNIVTGILKVYNIDAYALLDVGANFSFEILFPASRFHAYPSILNEPYEVCTPIE